MEVIAGPKGLAVARLVARAQLNRVKGMLKGGAAAPYLTARSRRVPMRETGTVNPWDSVILKDNAGAIKNYQWLFDTFGPITLERAPGVKCVDGKTRVMRLIEAQESIGPAVIVVKILKEDGSPWENMCVARGWPGAPGIPGTPPETIRWREEGVYGFTGVNGDIGYGLGTGDYYWRYDTQAGVSYVFTLGVMDEGVWTEGGGIPSDFVNGTGMLGGTEHQGLLRFKYQWVEVDGDEEPEPEDDEIVALLIEIRDLLAAGGGSFPAELNFAGKIKLPT